MAKSLYGRLYATLPKEGHSQKENFLTESLADLMQRMERIYPIDARRFIIEVLLADTGDLNRSLSTIRKRLGDTERVQWDTQKAIRLFESRRIWKRPDISIWMDGGCAILLEVKVTASFTQRAENTPENGEPDAALESAEKESKEMISQLEDYGRWLSEKDGPVALCLLTHSTIPPTDFVASDGDRRYSVELRSVARWRNVYNWLREWMIDKRGETDVERLCGEFVRYLEEQGMSEINDDDISVLNGFLAFSRRKEMHQIDAKIADAVRLARQTVHRFVPPHAKHLPPKDPCDARYNCFETNFAIYDWSYPYDGPEEEDLHLGWGLSDGENDNFFPNLTLPHKLQAFIYVQGNHVLASIEKTKYPSWIRASEFWIVSTDAATLARSESGFTVAFVQWLLPLAKEAAEILGEAWKEVGPKI